MSQADRDLALRLLNRPADAPWWSLGIGGVTLLPGGGGPPTSYEPDGELEPILADSLGAPVVAAWVPGEGNQRWYVIPDATDWNGILDWLIHRALPAHVPNALRRARSPHFADPSLQTAAEAAAREALGALEASYVEEKARLEDELRRTSGAADPIRYGLLYGTGSELVEAVASVLEQAGLTTVNVDDLLGGSTSADLLVSREDERRLVEVKSASGSASEALVGALERHLQTWPQFRPGEPVSGGVLIVNHQHTLEPHERAAAVYSRPEFVSVLAVPVISTRELFEWWRASDWASIREAVLATPNPGAEPKRAAPAAGAPPESSPPATRRLPRLPWRRNDN